MGEKFDFSIPVLGPRSVKSPIALSNVAGESTANYVKDDEYIRFSVLAEPGEGDPLPKNHLLERSGPRENIYFNPKHVHAAIVTCGGLCPGLNDVIRSVVRCLWHRYGVRRVSGIKYGYRGFFPEYHLPVMELNPEVVDDIHKIGGTILGSSRGGGERTGEIVDALERLNVNMLFTVGGDGTQKGSLAIAEEIEKRGLKIAVVGIPKTIDNDLSFIARSFGFETAVARAVESVTAAHTEADSAVNGIGLVKLMGRDSGFIAAQTVLASHEANFVLIPEIKFDLEGPNGFLSHLERRLEARNHAVVVVAEGAAQDLLALEAKAATGTDASGNKKLADVGVWLKDKIVKYFAEKKTDITLKYIDPSYIIRSSPAIPVDSVYCERLGANAVHAAMAGKTKLLIGLVNDEFVQIPIATATKQRKLVDPESALWRDALDATQQPLSMLNG